MQPRRRAAPHRYTGCSSDPSSPTGGEGSLAFGVPPAAVVTARRQRKPLPKVAWVAIAVVTVTGLVWIALLPMRQTDFRVVDHELVADGGGAIEGRLVRNGDAASNVLVEAYLYDEENRYLGTAQTSVPRIAGDGEATFRIPLDSRVADRVSRYTVYAGVRPNPFAPDR